MLFLIGIFVVVVLFSLPNPNRVGDETKRHFAPAHKGTGARLLFQTAQQTDTLPSEIPADRRDRNHVSGE